MKAKFGLANTLTAARLLLVLPSVWSIANGQLGLAASLFCAAVATDLADGRVARARGEVSALGGLFDHSVDAVYVASSFAALALPGSAVPLTPLLPVLVLLSFSQYALDSKVLAGKTLRASALGRYNGIGYFVLLGIALIGAAIGLPATLLLPVVAIGGWLLVASTLLSMLDRFLAYQKARGSP